MSNRTKVSVETVDDRLYVCESTRNPGHTSKKYYEVEF